MFKLKCFKQHSDKKNRKTNAGIAWEKKQPV